MTNHEGVRAALQALLDSEDNEGWLLSHYVVVMGVQKIDSDGNLKTTSWMTAPADQADYITTGLLEAADDIQANAEIEDD